MLVRLLASLSFALALAGLCAGLWLRPWLSARHDIDVRSVPWQTHSGRLQRALPIGQGFLCPAPNLERLEVAVAPLGDGRAPLELRLRRAAPDGPIVRQAQAPTDELPAGGGGFLVFEFEPLASSAGERLYFELLPVEASADVSAWVRYRGQPGNDDRPWGELSFPGPLVEGHMRSDHPWLRAIAVAVDTLPAGEAAAVELELLDQDGERVRVAGLSPDLPIRTGYAFFPFEPIPGSRWRNYRFRLHAPQSTRVVATPEGPSFFALHGEPLPREGSLLGMTVAGQLCPDRDLVFRARCARSPAEGLALLRSRLGARGLVGLGAWVLAVAALACAGWACRPRSSAPLPALGPQDGS